MPRLRGGTRWNVVMGGEYTGGVFRGDSGDGGLFWSRGSRGAAAPYFQGGGGLKELTVGDASP